MEIVKKIFVGDVPELNLMKMYRSVDMSECFTPICFENETNDGLKDGSMIKVKYKEWVENSLGQEIPELSKSKYYILKDDENWQPVAEFLASLWRGVVADERGLGDKIDNTLLHIPIYAPNCYVVQITDFMPK